MPDAAVSEVGDHLYVVPRSAALLLAAQRVDRDLFDVAGLIRLGYDDARRQTLPVIVDYGRGAAAAGEVRSASFAAAGKTVTLPALGAAAFAADKKRAAWLLARVDDDRGCGRRSDGARRRCDARRPGRARAMTLLDISVPQIHAPDCRAAGLRRHRHDGRRPGHRLRPDPSRSRRAASQARRTSSTDPSVVDGNGHGTDVASIDRRQRRRLRPASTRALRPARTLLVGKVLDRRRLRRGLVGPGRDGVGRRPGRRRREHEPRRRRCGDGTRPAQPRHRRALRELDRRCSSSRPATTAATGPSRSPHPARPTLRSPSVRSTSSDTMAVLLEPRPAPRRSRPQAGRRRARRRRSPPPAPPAPRSATPSTSGTPTLDGTSMATPARRRRSPRSSSRSTRAGTASCSRMPLPTRPFPSQVRRPSRPGAAASTPRSRSPTRSSRIRPCSSGSTPTRSRSSL